MNTGAGGTLDLQTLILNLQHFWAEQGCVIQQPLDLEVGAGTMHPETFLRVLGPEPYRVAYVQPSRRPADARYGENPFRLGRHLQLQVILKPSPDDVQNLYLQSLQALGIDPAVHDIRFEEDNWESPTLGAWGVGWQVLLDGMEVTQFTYFQQAGGIELAPISAELTYGLERIAMFLGRKDSIYDIEWGGGVPYGKIRLMDERESSTYGFEVADVEMLRRHIEDWESEARRCLDHEPPLVIPALEATLKTSHLFNLHGCPRRGFGDRAGRVSSAGCAKRHPRRQGLCRAARRARPSPGQRPRGGGVMATFLLELRTEEIPANALPNARRQLGDGLRKRSRRGRF